ncbi:MAG: hypothetical protein M1823_003083 [Watsoniomyces obsoletus]|nr:MAG: hypothetical protein M1823_003083 [Watsoniomyces obsoletus]
MSTNNLLPFIGWTFLPSLVTGWLQTIYYAISIRAGEPKPTPGSARHARHRRRIHILVISVYLLYTIYEADWEVRRSGDYYQMLGLTPDITNERDIKSKFRRLAALHHPDKQTSTQAQAGAEAYYVQLKLASDTLLNPAKRFAYDRFGPTIHTWQHCSSIRDYILMGTQTTLPFYVVGMLFLLVLTTLGYLEDGRFWRYFSSIALLTFELHTITRPYFPGIITYLNPLLKITTQHPPLLPFQLLLLARKVLLTVFIALAQLGPLLKQDPTARNQSSSKSKNDPEMNRLRHLHHLDQLAELADAETTRLLALEMNPFATARYPHLGDLKSYIRDFLVQAKIQAEPHVQRAFRAAIERQSEAVKEPVANNMKEEED